MLTKETITANESLKGLSEEQITAITTLSANDEASVLGEKFGRVYREMDASIEEATGIKRNGDEKTYVYLKRAATEYAAKYKDYDTLKSTIADLEEKLKKGGDEAIKSQLEQAQKELDATKAQFNTLKADFDKKEGEHKKALLDYKIDSEIAKAMEGMKFKATFNEGVLSTLKAKAIDTIKSKNPAFETRDGRERLIFHDENGAPLNNAENQLNPFTAKELLTKEFEAMDLLEKTPAKAQVAVLRSRNPTARISVRQPKRRHRTSSARCFRKRAYRTPTCAIRPSLTNSGTTTTLTRFRLLNRQRVA